MITEVYKPDAHFRDRKLGWIGRRHFRVIADTETEARESVKQMCPIGSRHPCSPLMKVQRIEPRGTDGGAWLVDALYWLPRSRNIQIEANGARK